MVRALYTQDIVVTLRKTGLSARQIGQAHPGRRLQVVVVDTQDNGVVTQPS